MLYKDNHPGRRYIFVALAVLILAALACSPGGEPDTPTPAPTFTPVPTATEPPPPAEEIKEDPAAGGEGGSLEIINSSNETVCYVYVSPSTSEEWGPEQLGAENVIAAGESFTLFGIPAGTYDMKAESCTNEILARNFDIKLGATDLTWTVGGATAQVVLENRSGITLCYLYITPDSSNGWGSDQFGEGMVVADGDDFTIMDIPPGTYDLRAESCDGLSAEHQDADVSSSFTWTITP